MELRLTGRLQNLQNKMDFVGQCRYADMLKCTIFSRELTMALIAFLKNKMPVFSEGVSRRHPWKFIHILAIAGLLARLSAAFYSNQINVFPDEIFQYLEQAHRLVFGYGYVPWEYRFGIRSWILPALISPILYLCKYLRIDTPIVYISSGQGIFLSRSPYPLSIAPTLLGGKLFLEIQVGLGAYLFVSGMN